MLMKIQETVKCSFKLCGLSANPFFNLILQFLGKLSQIIKYESVHIFTLQLLNIISILFLRQNLTSLEDLNDKWNLYRKPIFLDHLMAEFLTVFVQVLVSKSHNLLREEIAMSIYNMASVDFTAFFDKFLPHLLSGTEQLDKNQRTILLQGIQQYKLNRTNFK